MINTSYQLLARFFRGLSDPSRLSILNAMRRSQRSVSEVVRETGLSQPNVFNHLTCLKDCGLVTARQDGRQVFYRLNDSIIEELIRLAEDLLVDSAKGVFACTNLKRSERSPLSRNGMRHE